MPSDGEMNPVLERAEMRIFPHDCYLESKEDLLSARFAKSFQNTVGGDERKLTEMEYSQARRLSRQTTAWVE